MIDHESEFGQRVLRRLTAERIIWLTTVDAHGAPQPRPVWFWWDGNSFLIYSRPNTAKLRHIARNPHVALHFDGDGRGGDIVIFKGRAAEEHEAPPAQDVVPYCEKYAEGFRRIGMTAEEFGDAYSVPIRVQPEQLRGH